MNYEALCGARGGVKDVAVYACYHLVALSLEIGNKIAYSGCGSDFAIDDKCLKLAARNVGLYDVCRFNAVCRVLASDLSVVSVIENFVGVGFVDRAEALL